MDTVCLCFVFKKKTLRMRLVIYREKEFWPIYVIRYATCASMRDFVKVRLDCSTVYLFLLLLLLLLLLSFLLLLY